MLFDFILAVTLFWGFVHVSLFLLRTQYPRIHRRLIAPSNQLKNDGSNILPQHSDRQNAMPLAIISYSLLQLKVTTIALNDVVWRNLGLCNQQLKALLHHWFACGAIFGCIALVLSVVMMIVCCVLAVRDFFVHNHQSPTISFQNGTDLEWRTVDVDVVNRTLAYSSGPNLESPTNGRFLVSLIPGINLPLYAVGYYFFALFFAGVFHEAGHAIAASIEQVQMQAAGVFIWLIYPGAFVDLDDTALKFISPWAKLKIVCAGVWHNAVFAIISLVILMTLPSWIGWVYRDLRSIHNGSAWNGGVVVLDVEKQSPLHTNLPVGSIIMAVNEVQISFGVNDWDTGLAKALETSGSVRQGYCIDKEVISNGPASCCNVDLERPLGDYGNAYQCFLPHDIVNMRPLIELHKDALQSSPKSCVDLESVLRFADLCSVDGDCPNTSEPQLCMSAYIPNQHIRIIRLHTLDILERKEIKRQRKDHVSELNVTKSSKSHIFGRGNVEGSVPMTDRHIPIPLRTVLYLGDPREISESVRIGCFYPRHRYFPLSVPYKIERILHFLISFNTALAFFNMIPAQDMDGFHAFSALFDIFLEIQSSGTLPSGMTLGMKALSKLRLYKDRILRVLGRVSTLLLGILIIVATINSII